MMLQAQEYPCGPGEPFNPISVDAVLDNPEVALRQIGTGDQVMTWAPDGQLLGETGAGFFLDTPGTALDPGCLYEIDGHRFNGDRPPTIYGRVKPPSVDGDPLTVQYWFYWYFNLWNDTHEADWEGIQILFPASTAVEALDIEPVELGYAQHNGGEYAVWGDDKIELDGDRPFVYSSVGSHASYFQPGVMLGRGATEGFGCDDTLGPTRRVDPEVVLLPTEAADATEDLSWLRFPGRWGERHEGSFNGPTGPSRKDRWLDPVAWQETLRDGSIMVPGAGSSADRIADAFCAVVGWGSTQLISLQLAPWRVLVPASIILLIAFVLIRHTSWDRVPAVPVMRRRRGGEVLRGAVRVVRKHPKRFLAPALVALPAAGLVGGVVRLVDVVPVVDDLVDLINPATSEGWTQAFGSFVTGGIGIALAFWLTIGAVSLRLDQLEQGAPSTLGDTARRLTAMLRPLTTTLVLALVPTTLLAVIPFGLPVAIWLFVRWWFTPVVVVRDGLSGRAALRASASLTTDRFASTATMALVIQSAVTIGSLVVGVIVLSSAQALPLWALAGVVAGASAIITPVAAVAVVLLYGDASTAAATPEPA